MKSHGASDEQPSSIELEWRTFEERLKARLGRPHISRARGASNGPFVMENGFRFGLFNIDLSVEKIDALVGANRALALVTGLILPPRHALSLALVFSGEALERVGDRLEEIRNEPIPSGRKEGQRKGKANKVRVYLHSSGIYLRQDADPSRIDDQHGSMGRAVWASGAWYADVRSEPDLPPVAMTWLGFVGGLLMAMPKPLTLQVLGSFDAG